MDQATDQAVELTLLFREGCHLCEDMEASLAELLPIGSYTLRRIDIDETQALRAAENSRVPVLKLGERELCHHFLDLEAVREALASYNSAVTVGGGAAAPSAH